MNARRPFFAIFLLLVAVAAGLGTSGRFAGAALQDATPAANAATPTVDAATPVADAATPVAEPTDEPVVEPVTLVLGYVPDESGDFLVLTPVELDGIVLTAGDPEADVETQVDFDSPRNDNLPRIRYGNNFFNAYPVFAEDVDSVERWIYFNDDPEQRPSTLVLQIVCIRGEYEGYEGTATFVSRGGELGGTLVIALDPPAEE